MLLSKDAITARLNELLASANDARHANEKYGDASDADYCPMLMRLLVANGAVLLVNEGLNFIGEGPDARLNRLFAGLDAENVATISIDGFGQAEVVDTVKLDPNSPEAVRVANAYARLVEEQLDRVKTAVVDQAPPADLVARLHSDLARYDQECRQSSSDPYVQALHVAVRRLTKGAHEDLVFAGEEEAPQPTQKISVGGGQSEGQTTVSFKIPVGQPAISGKTKVGPLTRLGGLAAAVQETDLARFALDLAHEPTSEAAL